MQQLPVNCIFGAGRKTQATLRNLDVNQCADIFPIEKFELIRQFGKFGHRLYHFARGEDERPVCPSRERKSVSIEHTLDHDISPSVSPEILATLYQQLLDRIDALSTNKLYFKVFVKIKFGDFLKTTVEITTATLTLELCEKLFCQGWERQKKPIRLLGIGVRLMPTIGAEDDSLMQLNLFPQF
jgi:DNA polymerase-4